MDEQGYENQEIIEYLLGSLPAAKAERFDELSITDERFADVLDVAENELLDRYARGELAGDTLDKFKSHYLASPLRKDKAAFAETFQIYGEQYQGKPLKNAIFAQAKPKQTSAGFFSFFDSLKNKNRLRFGFAFAALLLMIASGYLFLNNQSKNETAKQNAPSNVQIEQPKPIEENQSTNANNEIAAVNSTTESTSPLPANESPQKNSNARPARTPEPEKPIAPQKTIVAAFLLSPSSRGDGELKSLSIPRETTEISMNLELEADEFPVYLIALADETGSINLWRSGKVKATGKGEVKHLNIRFPVKLLKSKIYWLVVSGVKTGAGDEIISNYPFRAVIK